jgi:hypothetical protein
LEDNSFSAQNTEGVVDEDDIERKGIEESKKEGVEECNIW